MSADERSEAAGTSSPTTADASAASQTNVPTGAEPAAAAAASTTTYAAPATSSTTTAPPAKKRRFRRSKENAFDKRFEGVARKALELGIHPNHLTFLQIPVFVFQLLAATMQWEWPFVISIAFVIMLDGGDGILARVGNLQSKTGAVLDAAFDTTGILIVMWGAGQFFPSLDWMFILLFIANFLLFAQNALLNHKVISYVRGPVLTAIVFPETLVVGLAIAWFILLWLLIVRLPASSRALVKMGYI